MSPIGAKSPWKNAEFTSPSMRPNSAVVRSASRLHCALSEMSVGTFNTLQRAVTDVTPLHATANGSFLSLLLRTGRTHQIRAHLAAIGHPLVGDWLYGQRNAVRPMLHAEEIAMTHPLTNTALRVAAPIPDDFQDEASRRGIVTVRGQSDTSRLQLNY